MIGPLAALRQLAGALATRAFGKPKRISSQDAFGTGTGGSATASYPGTPTQGNTLIAVCGGSGGGSGNYSVSDSGGSWTRITGISNGGQHADVFYKIATASQPKDITASRTGDGATRIAIHEYAGCATSSPISQSNASVSGAVGTSSPGASITTTKPGRMIYSAVFLTNPVTSPSVDSGLSVVTFQNRTLDADGIQSSAGAINPIFSWTGSFNSIQITISIKGRGT